MLQTEIRSMLLSLIRDKKAFNKFYKTGFFSYSNDRFLVGEVAIVNKAVISFLKDPNCESRIIATANFQDRYSLILELSIENFSHYCSGHSSRSGEVISGPLYCINKASVSRDISIILEHCTEAKLNSSRKSKFSDKKLSQQEVKVLIEDTLDKLHKAQCLSKREEVFPRVSTSEITATDISSHNTSVPSSIYDQEK